MTGVTLLGLPFLKNHHAVLPLPSHRALHRPQGTAAGVPGPVPWGPEAGAAGGIEVPSQSR